MFQPVLKERLQALAAIPLVVCLAFTAISALGFHTWDKPNAVPGKNLEISALVDQAGSAFADGTRKRLAGGNDLPKDLAARHAPCGTGECTSPALLPSNDNRSQTPRSGATPVRAPPSHFKI